MGYNSQIFHPPLALYLANRMQTLVVYDGSGGHYGCMKEGCNMSHTLHCDFKVRSNRGPVYWWPILFDLLRWHSFDFSAPDLPQGTSRFFWGRPVKETYESQLEEGPFKSLWDRVYEEERAIGVTAWFWYLDSEPLPLEVYMSAYAPEDTISIGVSFEGVYLMGVSPEVARQRLKQVLACVKSLSDVCQPSTGEIYWLYAGYSYAPWASFGKLPEPPSKERPSYGGPEQQLIREVLPSGGQFYLLHPVPIPERGKSLLSENGKPRVLLSESGEWKFLSLSE
jgi:hypothetical protein